MYSLRKSPLLIFLLPAVWLFVQLACASSPGAPLPVAVPTFPAAVPTQAQPVELPPAIPETRMLTLDFPPSIRAGDSDVVRLTLEVDDLGNLTPTVSVAGNVIQEQVISIPNLYATHNVLAEARLDIAGLDIRPGDSISESLLPGQKVTFYWSVLPTEVGKYKGTVWFYLHFISRADGSESRQALSAQVIEIESTSFFGLKASLTRWLGIGGTFLSSILGFPFLEDALRKLWARIRRRA